MLIAKRAREDRGDDSMIATIDVKLPSLFQVTMGSHWS